MQVKKFEAKTMKDALEMVKNELGPDAVILRARDNNRGFGLLGTHSVEITAAVSDATLKKKQFAESRLKPTDRAKLKTSPAKTQKHFIDKSVNRFAAVEPEPEKNYRAHNITQVNYADIEDDVAGQTVRKPSAYKAAPQTAPSLLDPSAGRSVTDLLRQINHSEEFTEEEVAAPAPTEKSARIHSAVKSAAAAFMSVQDTPSTPATRRAQLLEQKNDEEVRRLKEEIDHLRKTVDKFKQMPRSIVNAHPGAEHGLRYELSHAYERLHEAGIVSENIVLLLRKAQAELSSDQLKNKNIIEAWIAHSILNELKVTENTLDGRIHIFVGSGGQGKTSALAKLGSQFVAKQKKKVALLTADTLKIGAADQIKIYAQILNGYFGVIKEKSDWEKRLAECKDADVILVDFPGLSLRDSFEAELLQKLLPPQGMDAKVHLVQSVTSKDADAIELGRRYTSANFTDVIFTHLDESVNHGLIYNFQKYFEVPLHSFGVGPRIPNDFEAATKERVLDLIFKITKTARVDRSS